MLEAWVVVAKLLVDVVSGGWTPQSWMFEKDSVSIQSYITKRSRGAANTGCAKKIFLRADEAVVRAAQ